MAPRLPQLDSCACETSWETCPDCAGGRGAPTCETCGGTGLVGTACSHHRASVPSESAFTSVVDYTKSLSHAYTNQAYGGH